MHDEYMYGASGVFRRGDTMITRTLLESLSRLPSPLLTAYVRTTPDEATLQGAAPRYLHSLKEEGRSIAESLASEEREPCAKQLERVMEFLSQKPKSHGSLVIFAGPTVWEVVLQSEVRNELSWGKPSLAQLFWLAGEHKQYGIVAVNHKGARFFHYSLGEIVEGEVKKFAIDISGWRQKDLGKVSGEGVAKTHGTQRDVFDKRVDNQYVRLCRETAQQAATFFLGKELAAVFLVGPDKLIAAIQAKFPRNFRLPIVRDDQDLARLSPPELLAHLEPRIADWEREHKKALVAALAEDARGAIFGFEETFLQLQRGMVRTLVLARDFDAPLHQCHECGWKGRCTDRVCPVCEGETGDTTLRDILPEILLRHAVELEIVSAEPAERLNQMGGIAGRPRQKKVTAKAAASQ
jgi:Bacterial archaeo-eukaryotic release factor family 10